MTSNILELLARILKSMAMDDAKIAGCDCRLRLPVEIEEKKFKID